MAEIEANSLSHRQVVGLPGRRVQLIFGACESYLEVFLRCQHRISRSGKSKERPPLILHSTPSPFTPSPGSPRFLLPPASADRLLLGNAGKGQRGDSRDAMDSIVRMPVDMDRKNKEK
jgi:hypothetical protein